MKVVILVSDGLVDLGSFDAVRRVFRGGNWLLVGEQCGAMIDHVLAFFSCEQAAADAFDRLLEYVKVIDGGVIDLRGYTVFPTEGMRSALLVAAEEAIVEEKPKKKIPRSVFQLELKPHFNAYPALFGLRGRRVSEVEISGVVVALICNEELV